MSKLFYVKVTTNDSKVFDLQEKRIELKEIMDEVYSKFNDTSVYEKEKNYFDREKEENVTRVEEKYSFSEIEKFFDGENKYIIGKLIRRKPIFSEEYNENTKKAKEVVYDKNATSIRFYFDILNQLVVFAPRNTFGHMQFKEGFEKLLNKMTNTTFKLGFVLNTYSLLEKIKDFKKVTVLEATYIPINANEEEYETLLDHREEEMKETNAHEYKVSFKSNDGGLNLNSKRIARVLQERKAVEKLKRGYVEINGEAEDTKGSKIIINSSEDAPFNTEARNMKKLGKESFIEEAQAGLASVFRMFTLTKFKK